MFNIVSKLKDYPDVKLRLIDDDVCVCVNDSNLMETSVAVLVLALLVVVLDCSGQY